MRISKEQLLKSGRTIPRTHTELGDIQTQTNHNTSLETPEVSHLSSRVKLALKFRLL